MSSVNPHFTFPYAQPVEARFSHDSVFLARRAFEVVRDLQQPIAEMRVLDLCAGCGVVGLDFIFHAQKELSVAPKRCDFIDVQPEYAAYFELNLQNFPGLRAKFLVEDFCTLPSRAGRYDLILCNPPYFNPGQGKLPPNRLKARSRFYVESDFAGLVRVMSDALAEGGHAFCLVRDLRDHNIDQWQTLRDNLIPGVKCERLEDVRGTGLAYLAKSRPR